MTHQVFHAQRRVEWHDTDAGGIAHFTSLLRYMEEAEHALLRSLQLTVHQSQGDAHLSFPRVSVRCEYHSPARFEDVLDIDVAVVRLGDKSVTYEFGIACEGRPVADGAITAVCCRIAAGQLPESIVIPVEIAQKLRSYLRARSD